MPKVLKTTSTTEELKQIYQEKDKGKLTILLNQSIESLDIFEYLILPCIIACYGFLLFGLAISAFKAEPKYRLNYSATVAVSGFQISSLINLALTERIETTKKDYLSRYDLKIRIHRAKFKRRELAVTLLLKSTKVFIETLFKFEKSQDAVLTN